MQTENHKLYYQALRDKKMYPTVAYGCAGTSKTYGAIAAAYEALMNKKVSKIICTRPNVSFADKNGFLPGTEREKMAPWVRPLLQHLSVFCSKQFIEQLEANGKLEFYPLEFIQGMTFDNAFIIVDEVQNMSFEQLKVFLTRTGKYSKVVMCGDVAQVSPKFPHSGLAEFIRMTEKLDLPVHSLQRDRIGFRKLLIPEYHRVIVHQCIQFPFCMIRGSSYMKLCVLLRKLIQFH